MNEAHPIRPLCPYAVSKHTFEHYLELILTPFTTSITRCCAMPMHGPRQDPHHEGGVVAIFAYKLLSGEVPVIYGDGGQTRDFVHVTDLVRAPISPVRVPETMPAIIWALALK